MIEHNSPLYWVVSLVVLVAVAGGLYAYVTFFWGRVEPAARRRVEVALGVRLEHSVLGIWTVASEPGEGGTAGGAAAGLAAFAVQLALVLVFVTLLLAAGTALWLLLAALFRPPG